MPVYNGAKYLKDAMDSILSQTYAYFEFIVINDGSSDASEDIILAYKDERIVYLKNETNSGLIFSLNKGIRHAKGRYIARMDADDIALPERLQEQVAVFENNKGIIATGSDYFLLDNVKLTRIKNTADSDFIKTCLLFAPYFNHPTMMIKNIFVEQDLFYDKDFIHAEDYKMWTDLSFHGRFYNVSKPLLKYRAHSSQISSKFRDSQLVISERIRKSYLERLGFVFSDEEFRVHNVLSNNEFIRSQSLLLQIGSWLQSLADQDKRSGKINVLSFNKAIHKFWIECCGNTNLGLTAYKIYAQSQLSQYSDNAFSERVKLLVKCMLRQFK